MPQQYGGLGLDLVTTCLIVEEVAKQCPSTAMCYKMHLEAVEAISHIPTAYQRQRYIEPLLRGEVFAAAPGGEPHGATGDDWTPVRAKVSTLPRGRRPPARPRAQIVRDLGGPPRTTSCSVGSRAAERGEPPELLMFKHDEVSGDHWRMGRRGLRGNCSVPMIFNGVVPEANLVGIELEDKSVPVMTKYMAPCQILTYGAAYLGIASGAFALACAEGDKRFPSGTGSTTHQSAPHGGNERAHRSGESPLAHGGGHGGRGTGPLRPAALQAKVLCAEVGVRVTTELMTMFGGTAFAVACRSSSTFAMPGLA